MKVDSGKVESILSLSLETEPEVREKSDILGNGYNFETNIWEVIVKYNGDISFMEAEVESLELLLNGYAIMRATRAQLERILGDSRIEFVELPKSLVFDSYLAKQQSCILPVSAGNLGLRGSGVLVAVIDSGIQYQLDDFQNENGSRILFLWDQTLQPDSENGMFPPKGFYEGVEFNKADLDKGGVPSFDSSGHGTAVAAIAAGSSLSPLYQGVAPESELLIVKIGGNRNAGMSETTQNFPLTTDLMRALTYVLQKAEELGRPVAVNISIGDTYGAHDGTSLLERFIDAACEKGRNVICIGSGNEAVAQGHRRVNLAVSESERVELSVAFPETGINVQIWKNYADRIVLEVIAPGGDRYTVMLSEPGKQEWITQKTRVLIYISPPTPYSVNEEIFFDLIPLEEFVDDGIWTFVLSREGEIKTDIHFFLPNAVVRNSRTHFLRSDPYLTITIPGFASRAITVGAYDGVLDAAADFSGRDRRIGEEERVFFASDIKPDIAAPGVNIIAPERDGQYRSFTGTSFATPIVTGSAALLLEWGIIRGNDLFLYGEKVKAYLRKGARRLRGDQEYPNVRTGWGALCVQESIPQQDKK